MSSAQRGPIHAPAATRRVSLRPRLVLAGLSAFAALVLVGCALDGDGGERADRLVPTKLTSAAAEGAPDEGASSSPRETAPGGAAADDPRPILGGADPSATAERLGAGPAACPDRRPGFLLHAEASFCLLVPEGYAVQNPMPGRTVIVASTTPPDGGPAAQLLITEEGAAGGRSTAEFAQERTAQIMSAGVELTVDGIVLAGEQAITAEVVPGVAPARQAFVVHDDRIYILTLLPVDPERPEVSSEAQRLWRVALESFAFR